MRTTNLDTKLIRERKNRGLTQTEISKILKTAPSFYTSMENKSKNMSEYYAKALSVILNIPYSDISSEYTIIKGNKKTKKTSLSNLKSKTIILKDYNFDTPSKVVTRQLIADHIKPNSKILTLPSTQGLCVKKAIQSGAKPENIWCVDKDKRVMDIYEKLNLGTNNFVGYLHEFFRDNIRKFDIIYLDYCGLLGEVNLDTLFQATVFLNDNGIIAVTCIGFDRTGKDKKLTGRKIPRIELVKEILKKSGKSYKFMNTFSYKDKAYPMDFFLIKFRKKILGIF